MAMVMAMEIARFKAQQNVLADGKAFMVKGRGSRNGQQVVLGSSKTCGVQASSRRRLNQLHDQFGMTVSCEGLQLWIAASRQSLFSLMSLSRCRVDSCSDGSHDL